MRRHLRPTRLDGARRRVIETDMHGSVLGRLAAPERSLEMPLDLVVCSHPPRAGTHTAGVSTDRAISDGGTLNGLEPPGLTPRIAVPDWVNRALAGVG